MYLIIYRPAEVNNDEPMCLALIKSAGSKMF